MNLGFVGKKCGMTRIFDENGRALPVTVVEVEPHYVSAIKNTEKHGYSAVQVAAGEIKQNKLNKSQKGLFTKIGIGSKRYLREFRVSEEALTDYELGQELSISLLNENQMVNVVSTSKGKGFAGVIKRHNFKSGRASHGNSKAHNKPGSIGQCQDPGRVFKGKKMAGHMGSERVTIKNLKIIKVSPEDNIVAIHGSIPGANGSVVIIKAVK